MNSADAALKLIRDTLNGVEDEWSGTPYSPEKWQDDGRLYPPNEDFARPISDSVKEFRHVSHSTFIATNGAFEIVRRRDGHVEIAKAGRDRDRLKRSI